MMNQPKHQVKAALGIIAALFCLMVALSVQAQEQILFNGTNLEGWVTMNGAIVTVTNGVICIEGGKGWLRRQEVYKNFELTAEWRGLKQGYNSGVFIRAPLTGDPWAPDIWQINTKESEIGQLLRGPAEVVKSVTPAVAVGTWVRFDIVAQGTNLTITVDGKPAWEFHELRPADGYIGLQAEGKPFEFRNLKIRRLD